MIKNLEQLASILNAIYPTRYSHFDEKQQTPFICYISDGDDNFHADNTIYAERPSVDIELYTSYKDLDAEKAISRMLLANDLIYDKSPTIFIQAEETYQTVFTIQLLDNGGK